jgi:hypothetical protein
MKFFLYKDATKLKIIDQKIRLIFSRGKIRKDKIKISKNTKLKDIARRSLPKDPLSKVLKILEREFLVNKEIPVGPFNSRKPLSISLKLT